MWNCYKLSQSGSVGSTGVDFVDGVGSSACEGAWDAVDFFLFSDIFLQTRQHNRLKQRERELKVEGGKLCTGRGTLFSVRLSSAPSTISELVGLRFAS